MIEMAPLLLMTFAPLEHKSIKYRKLLKKFAILVESILVKYLPAFALFENYVCKHIMHNFSKKAGQLSEQHCLGLVKFDENKPMLQILTHISKMYVSHFYKDQRDERISGAPLHRVKFEGDHMAAERIRNCQKAIINGSCHLRDGKVSLPMQKISIA